MLDMESLASTTAQKELSIKKIRSRYRKCVNEIAVCYSAPGNTGEESVHNLRINLKRVDALIGLLEYTGHKIPARKLKPFKTLFRLAGKLRSSQIEFGVIEKHFTDDSLNTNYLHQLHEIKAKRLAAFSKYLQCGVPRSLKAGIQFLKEKISQVKKKHITRHLNTEKKKLKKMLPRSIFREQELHSIRKDLKRYYLNSKMIEHDYEQLEKMLDLLGEWHDHQMAFDHVVKAIYTGRLTVPESEPVKQIKSQLITDKENLYEKIVAYYVEEIQDGGYHNRIVSNK